MENHLIVRTIAIAAVLIVLSMGGCAAHASYQTRLKVEALVNGKADPLDIPCAADTATERYCELRAASRKQ